MVTFRAEVQGYDSTGLLGTVGGVGWRLDPSRSAVLVHDMQPYYLQVLPARVRDKVVGAATLIAQWGDRQGVPILASGPRPAVELAQRGLGGRLWGCGPTPEEAAETAISGLDAPEVAKIHKRSYSAFYGTDLEVELRRADRSQLVLVGIFATGGVLATAYDALARDIEVFVVVEATADYTVARHRTALELIASGIGQVVGLDQILSCHPGDEGELVAPEPEHRDATCRSGTAAGS